MNTPMQQITTSEFAKYFGVQSTTVTRSHCLNGNYMGYKPLVLPNRRLLWPVPEHVKGEAA